MTDGIANIVHAIDAWRLVGVAAGVFALMNPPLTLVSLLAVISAFAVVGGTAILVGAFRLRRAADDIAATVNSAFRTT